MTRKRRTKQEKEQQKKEAVAVAQAKFFGGITYQEASEVFKTLAILAQFPGANPPEPLQGKTVTWSSVMHVGDSKEDQVFNIQVVYKGLLFQYTAKKDRGIQLPDSTFMNFESWHYQALLIANQFEIDK